MKKAFKRWLKKGESKEAVRRWHQFAIGGLILYALGVIVVMYELFAAPEAIDANPGDFWGLTFSLLAMAVFLCAGQARANKLTKAG